MSLKFIAADFHGKGFYAPAGSGAFHVIAEIANAKVAPLLEELERLRTENRKLRDEIQFITEPNLKTQYPMVYHPNHLRDPELGPIVQKQLADGSALLSQPMCLDCAEKADELAALKAEIESAPVVYGYTDSVTGSPQLNVDHWTEQPYIRSNMKARLVRIEKLEDK